MKPVARTAWYCCAVRALDAASAAPVCGDQLAVRFMTPQAWKLFEPFRAVPEANASNVARHRIVDDLLRARLAARPDTTVVLLGAGFDTRPFRLPGGRWIELDEPALLALKEAELPAATAASPLTRVAAEFDTQSVAEVLAPWRGLVEPVVVLEGVIPYLAPAELTALLEAVRDSFVRPTLICDLRTPKFVRRYSARIGRMLEQLGAPYGRMTAEEVPLIEAAGFRLVQRESVIGKAAELKLLRVPRWLLATVLRALRDGYTIGVFEADGRGPGGPAGAAAL
jgi:O-methyltransferase involved in polyketide biosynthesis